MNAPSLYVQDNLADFYLETYQEGLTKYGSDPAYVIKTELHNAYTISHRSNFEEISISLTGFWAPSSGTDTQDGELFPALIRVVGRLTLEETSDKIGIFFEQCQGKTLYKPQ